MACFSIGWPTPDVYLGLPKIGSPWCTSARQERPQYLTSEGGWVELEGALVLPGVVPSWLAQLLRDEALHPKPLTLNREP